LAKPRYSGAFALKAKATAGHFISWISLIERYEGEEDFYPNGKANLLMANLLFIKLFGVSGFFWGWGIKNMLYYVTR
jgi:hypothetical protein